MASEVGDIFEVAAVGNLYGQRIMLTHHYRLISINPGVQEDVATESLLLGVSAGVGGGDVLESSYLALLPFSYTLDYWRVQEVAPIRIAFQTRDRAVAGGHASDTEATNQAAVITLRTFFSGRNQISNKHIGPIPQAATVQADGSVAGAYLTLMDLLKNSLLSSVVDLALGAEWRPIIWHGPLASNYDYVLNGQSQDTLRVMRRRTVRLGV